MVQVFYNDSSLCLECVLTVLPMNSTIGQFVNISQNLDANIDSFTYGELVNHEVALTIDILDKGVPLEYSQPITITIDGNISMESVSVCYFKISLIVKFH